MKFRIAYNKFTCSSSVVTRTSKITYSFDFKNLVNRSFTSVQQNKNLVKAIYDCCTRFSKSITHKINI